MAAGVALLVYPDGGELPTSVLAAWAEAGGPLAALAARALPSRDDDVLRGRLKRLLEGYERVRHGDEASRLRRSRLESPRVLEQLGRAPIEVFSRLHAAIFPASKER